MKSNRVLASLAVIAFVVGVTPSLLGPSPFSGLAFAQSDRVIAQREVAQDKGTPRKDAPKKDALRKDAPKKDAPKKDAQKSEPQKKDVQKKDVQKKDLQKKDVQKKEPPKNEPQRKEAQRQDFQRKDLPKSEPQRNEAQKKDVQKREPQKIEPQQKEAQKNPQRKEAPKDDTLRKVVQNKEPQRKEFPKKEGSTKEPVKPNPRDLLTRTPFTLADQAVAVIPGIPNARIWGDSETEFNRVLPTASGPWLALSGGGADGAFGAGLLIGWTQSGNRPDFAVVTGSSIGALIAPYAFLGPEFDVELTKNFTDITAADVFEDKPTPESFLDTWPLKKMIEKRVTRNLLKAIAAEHAKGRRFLVATTNLDAGRRVIWNMGAIAAQGNDKALKLFRDVLQASASIPGFFPPVAIEVEANGKKFREMHLDGTITSPFFMIPESTSTSTDARLPTDQFYVIINSKLTSDFSLPNRQVHAILGRSIGVALVTGLRAELTVVTTSARQLGIGLSVAHVPEDFTEVNRGLFDQVYMQALFRYATEQAMNGRIFQNLVQAQSKAQVPGKKQMSVEAGGQAAPAVNPSTDAQALAEVQAPTEVPTEPLVAPRP